MIDLVEWIMLLQLQSAMVGLSFESCLPSGAPPLEMKGRVILYHNPYPFLSQEQCTMYDVIWMSRPPLKL